MNQQTFSDIEYSNRKRKTKREELLDSMEENIPWNRWTELISEHYPSGKCGRPPRGIETMLRIYLMQNWFNLRDAAIEDAIYDSYAMRNFMHIDFLDEQILDATIIVAPGSTKNIISTLRIPLSRRIKNGSHPSKG